MKIKINEHFLNVKESYLFSEIGRRVREYAAAHPDKKIIRLGIGDVTLPLTPTVIAAMRKATDEMGVQSTFRGYAPEYGYDFVRDAVKNHYEAFGVSLSRDEIFVSDGAKSDVGNIVDILGDNPVLIPDPVYPVYMDSNIMAGHAIELLEANESNGFLPLPPAEEKAYVVYLCSPNNPTGAVYNREQLKIWVDYANRTGSLIIFDSAYEAYIHGDYPHSVYEIEGAKTCVIEICSLSKTAGFTGTRCAWTVVPADLKAGDVSLNKLWARRQATKFNGVSYITQRGAAAAYSDEGYAQLQSVIADYMENARIISALLEKKGIWYSGGLSSPYIWLRCPGGMGSWEFFDYLLANAQVVGTPGAGFGKAGEGYFRLTSFGDRAATEEAVRRLNDLL